MIYSTIPTQVGAAKLRNASLLGQKVNITRIAFGDGDGAEYEPTGQETELKNQVYECPPNRIEEEPTAPSWIELEAVIPSNVGGWYLREVGCYDDAGDLIFIGNLPSSFKPSGEAGVIKDLVFEMVYDAVASEVVEIKINPNVVIATRKYVDDSVKDLATAQYVDDKVKDLATTQYVDEALGSIGLGFVEVSSEAQEAEAFANGALAVIRLDLLSPRSSLFVNFDNPTIFEDLSEFSHSLVSVGTPLSIVDSASPMLGRVGDFTSGGYLKVADDPSFILSGKSWGIEAYVKLKTINVSNFIVSKGQPGVLNDAWYLAILWNGSKLNLAFVGSNNTPIFNVEYPYGTDTVNYHHISVNCDGSTIKVYLDGELYTYSVVPSIYDGIGDLNIGHWNYGSANTAGCYIDNLVITNDGPLRTDNFTPPSA